jgi:hypothetical protein
MTEEEPAKQASSAQTPKANPRKKKAESEGQSIYLHKSPYTFWRTVSHSRPTDSISNKAAPYG